MIVRELVDHLECKRREMVACILLRHRDATFEEADAAWQAWAMGGPYMMFKPLTRQELADLIWNRRQ